MALKSSAIAKVTFTAFLIAASAQATILNEYSDLSSWNAVTTSQVTQNFNGIGSPSSGTSAGVTLNSVKYLGYYNESSTIRYDTYLWGAPVSGFDIGSSGYMMGGSNAGGVDALGTGVSTPDSGMRVDVSSLAALNALSFNFSALRFASSNGSTIYSTVGTPINLLLEVYEGGALTGTRTLTVPAGSPAAGFFGFTATGSISSIRILISTPTGTDGNRVILDNLAYAQIAAGGGGGEPSGGEVPEPQTFILCGAGLLCVAFFSRKGK